MQSHLSLAFAVNEMNSFQGFTSFVYELLMVNLENRLFVSVSTDLYFYHVIMYSVVILIMTHEV